MSNVILLNLGLIVTNAKTENIPLPKFLGVNESHWIKYAFYLRIDIE